MRAHIIKRIASINKDFSPAQRVVRRNLKEYFGELFPVIESYMMVSTMFPRDWALQRIYDSFLNEGCIYTAFVDSFDWEETSEGYSFWRDVYNQASEEMESV